MKEREITKYPDSLITVSASMVINIYLLASFIRLLFKKTNIHNYKCVSATFRILDAWFNSIHSNGLHLKFGTLESQFWD